MKQNRILQYIIQIIGWGAVFSFPLFFTWKESEPMTWMRYVGYVFVPVAFMVIFYINYFLLVDRLLFRKRLFRFLLVNMVLVIVLTLVLDWWHEFHFFEIMGHEHRVQTGPPKMMFLVRDVTMMALTVALCVAIKMTNNWYVIENERRELEKARTEAELQNLKSQLNPHFLFNTLNNIYSLIAIDADRAQYAVHDLSRMLRHVLYEDRAPFVSLDSELDFMRSYIELMSLRLTNHVDLQVDMPEGDASLQVAPLLFITLVENAFKHGVSPTEPSFIHIAMCVLPERTVVCHIENSDFPKHDNDRSGSGIGLENLRKRLELLYPDRYTLDKTVENGKYIAHLEIQCQNNR